MTSEIKEIGRLTIDTGKIMFCDPAFLSDWEHRLPRRRYRDRQTGNVYEYGLDFQDFTSILPERKSPAELIAEKSWEKMPSEEPAEAISYANLMENLAENGFWQALFPNGKAGPAFALALDDGEYPIMCEIREGKLARIWMEFL